MCGAKFANPIYSTWLVSAQQKFAMATMIARSFVIPSCVKAHARARQFFREWKGLGGSWDSNRSQEMFDKKQTTFQTPQFFWDFLGGFFPGKLKFWLNFIAQPIAFDCQVALLLSERSSAFTMTFVAKQWRFWWKFFFCGCFFVGYGPVSFVRR